MRNVEVSHVQSVITPIPEPIAFALLLPSLEVAAFPALVYPSLTASFHASLWCCDEAGSSIRNGYARGERFGLCSCEQFRQDKLRVRIELPGPT